MQQVNPQSPPLPSTDCGVCGRGSFSHARGSRLGFIGFLERFSVRSLVLLSGKGVSLFPHERSLAFCQKCSLRQGASLAPVPPPNASREREPSFGPSARAGLLPGRLAAVDLATCTLWPLALNLSGETERET